MSDLMEADFIDTLRTILARRKIKLIDLAKSIGVPYRNVQNYFYKKARMPIEVYVQICETIGVTADYPMHGRFRLEHHDLQNALIEVFGEEFFNCVEFDEHLRWSMVPIRPTDLVRIRRVAGVFAGQLASEYDLIREGALGAQETEI